MTTLESAVKSFGSVVQSSKGGDSQAAQLELLHDIEQLVRLGNDADIKEVQKDLEKHLTAALLLGPAPPLRRLICSTFVYAYGRGARTNMYSQVGTVMQWLNAGSKSPASSMASKVALFALLGDLCQAHGSAMVALCQDTIALLVKSIRLPEMPLRAAALTALASALVGSGGIPPATQQEVLKNIKAVLSERGVPVELRQACLGCCASLCAYSEQLWASTLVEEVMALGHKHLDDPSSAVRLSAAEALGLSAIAAMAHPFTGAAPAAVKGKPTTPAPKPRISFGKGVFERRPPPSTAMEAAVGLLLSPFGRPGVTKELRLGVARSFVTFSQQLRKPDRERYAVRRVHLSASDRKLMASDCNQTGSVTRCVGLLGSRGVWRRGGRVAPCRARALALASTRSSPPPTTALLPAHHGAPALAARAHAPAHHGAHSPARLITPPSHSPPPTPRTHTHAYPRTPTHARKPEYSLASSTLGPEDHSSPTRPIPLSPPSRRPRIPRWP